MNIEYMKVTLHKYTFKLKKVREWVENECDGLTLNLFAGKTKLNINEVRNDVDNTMVADYHIDALDFVRSWNGETFNTIILDPPYSYRKSMEMYNGNLNSRFKLIKDVIADRFGCKVITFGYHSISMGKKRGYKVDKILLMYHGGAIHDTICSVESKLTKKGEKMR